MAKKENPQDLEAAAVKGGGLTTPDDVPTGRDRKKPKPEEEAKPEGE